MVSGASPPNIGLSTESKGLQWLCSQLSSNVFHFRENNQRSNQTYSLPWPQAVNIRCAQHLAEVVREPGQRPCSIWHRRRLQLVPSPSFVPLHCLNRDQSPSSSVPTSPSQKEQEAEEEEPEEEEPQEEELDEEDLLEVRAKKGTKTKKTKTKTMVRLRMHISQCSP